MVLPSFHVCLWDGTRQTWQQMPLPTEQSHQRCQTIFFLVIVPFEGPQQWESTLVGSI